MAMNKTSGALPSWSDILMGKGAKKLVTKGMPPENFRCAKCDGGDKNGDELRRWGDPASKGG